jgi:hypothetical protein
MPAKYQVGWSQRKQTADQTIFGFDQKTDRRNWPALRAESRRSNVTPRLAAITATE